MLNKIIQQSLKHTAACQMHLAGKAFSGYGKLNPSWKFETIESLNLSENSSLTWNSIPKKESWLNRESEPKPSKPEWMPERTVEKRLNQAESLNLSEIRVWPETLYLKRNLDWTENLSLNRLSLSECLNERLNKRLNQTKILNRPGAITEIVALFKTGA